MTTTAQLTSPPGYGPVVPIDKNRHAGLGLAASIGHDWCANLNACYVSTPEFARAALDYPIAFARDPVGGPPLPLAVLGLQQKNLFVDGEGLWRPNTYVPAYIRRFPFCIAEVRPEDKAPQRLVCLQEDQLIKSDKPLFDAEGGPTEDWKPIQNLLEAIEGARQQTAELAKQLEALDLLVPFDALALPRTGTQMRLQGLLRVDEQKLQKLPAKDLRALLSKGSLRVVYSHLISLENFARLLEYTQAQAPQNQGN